MAFRLFATTGAILALASVACKKTESADTSAPSPQRESVATELAEAFSGENAHRHVSNIVAFGPRPPGSTGYSKTVDYLDKVLSDQGWVVRREPFQAETPRGVVTFLNVIARHRSAPAYPASPPILIGGHIDSKHLPFPFVGANDGGSSTGIMLEMARVLSTDPATAAKVEFVFFDGEEAWGENITPSDGLYGSKNFARNLMRRPTRPALGVVLDIVGDPDHPLLYNPEAPASFKAAIPALAGDLDFPAGVRPSPGQIVDDHLPLQYAGVPCVHLIGDFTTMDYWHQPGDTLEKVRPEMLEKVGKLVLRYLWPQP